MRIIPYINLAGNAEEALNFYKEIFGGEIEIMLWGDMPPDPKMPVSDDGKDKVMHGTLAIREDVLLFASDSFAEGESLAGNNVYIHIEFDSEEEVRKAYAALSSGAKIGMPIDKTFWGAIYGDLVDKYGIGWGLHYQIPE